MSASSSTLKLPTPRVFLSLIEPRRYKGAKGGRGSGKSHFFAELAVEQSVLRRTDIVCVREIQRTLDQSVKKLIELKIEAFGLGSRFSVQDRVITSDLGGRIIFEGMQNHNAESIKSLEGYDIAWVEEAQTLSQRSLDLLRPTIRKEGSELWFSWNPNQPTDPVDAFFADDPPDSVLVTALYSDNPWFPEVLRKDMEWDRARDPEKYAWIWLGEYQRNSEARVFKNWKVEEFPDLPAGTIYRLGADWGYAIDPSVLVRCSIEGRRLYVDHEAYMVGCEIDQLPDLFDRVPESRRFFITADSARPETISYMQRKGGYPKIQAAIKGPRSIEEGVAFLQSFDIVVHPRCQHVIDELTLYSYKRDPLTGKVLPMLEDKHNHCIDALRYACEGARKAVRTDMKPLRYSNAGIV